MRDAYWWIDLRYDGTVTISHTLHHLQYGAKFQDPGDAVDTLIAQEIIPLNMKDTPDHLRRGGTVTFALRNTLTAKDIEAAGFEKMD